MPKLPGFMKDKLVSAILSGGFKKREGTMKGCDQNGEWSYCLIGVLNEIEKLHLDYICELDKALFGEDTPSDEETLWTKLYRINDDYVDGRPLTWEEVAVRLKERDDI